MKASLDTNVIIHFYKAELEDILFDFFSDGVIIYEQIRNVELEHHGKDVLIRVDEDIAAGKIKKYTDENLKELEVFGIFKYHVNNEKNLYSIQDMGEVYAIALAKTLGAYSLVTDDRKQGGPYMSLLNFSDEIMPFNFADVLFLNFFLGGADIELTHKQFNKISDASGMRWDFTTELKKFVKRFLYDPYLNRDYEWFISLMQMNDVKYQEKLKKSSCYVKSL